MPKKISFRDEQEKEADAAHQKYTRSTTTRHSGRGKKTIEKMIVTKLVCGQKKKTILGVQERKEKTSHALRGTKTAISTISGTYTNNPKKLMIRQRFRHVCATTRSRKRIYHKKRKERGKAYRHTLNFPHPAIPLQSL